MAKVGLEGKLRQIVVGTYVWSDNSCFLALDQQNVLNIKHAHLIVQLGHLMIFIWCIYIDTFIRIHWMELPFSSGGVWMKIKSVTEGDGALLLPRHWGLGLTILSYPNANRYCDLCCIIQWVFLLSPCDRSCSSEAFRSIPQQVGDASNGKNLRCNEFSPSCLHTRCRSMSLLDGETKPGQQAQWSRRIAVSSHPPSKTTNLSTTPSQAAYTNYTTTLRWQSFLGRCGATLPNLALPVFNLFPCCCIWHLSNGTQAWCQFLQDWLWLHVFFQNSGRAGVA